MASVWPQQPLFSPVPTTDDDAADDVAGANYNDDDDADDELMMSSLLHVIFIFTYHVLTKSKGTCTMYLPNIRLWCSLQKKDPHSWRNLGTESISAVTGASDLC